jgi:hypothetical protein
MGIVYGRVFGIIVGDVEGCGYLGRPKNKT